MNTAYKKRRFRKFGIGVSLGIALLSAGTGFLDNTNMAYAATATSTSIADQIISTGLKYQGVPYQFGAKSGRTDVFDCSSFTQFVFKQSGISLPRSSRQQSTVGTFVPRDQLQPGDLVFFYSPIHHVAIYMGDGKLLHTFGKGGVTVTSLNTGWWNSHYATARRVLP
ncbi:C40 family peptidase [Paenibacillus sp. BAC0078]